MTGQKAILALVGLAGVAVLAFSLLYAGNSEAGRKGSGTDRPEMSPRNPKVTIDWSRLQCAPKREKAAGKPKHDLSLLYKHKKITSMTVELTKEEYERIERQNAAKARPDN